MYKITLLITGVLSVSAFGIDKNKGKALHMMELCYKAKTCIHNAVEKCGANSKGDVRRFLDSCDILEYNCIHETDFKKTGDEICSQKQVPELPQKLMGHYDNAESSESSEDY